MGAVEDFNALPSKATFLAFLATEHTTLCTAMCTAQAERLAHWITVTPGAQRTNQIVVPIACPEQCELEFVAPLQSKGYNVAVENGAIVVRM
jgi:hypothetical protein